MFVSIRSLLYGSGCFAAIEDGLIGYWPLNGDARDYSVHSNNGTLLPGASFVDNSTGAGKVLQSVLGEAGTGHVKVGLPVEFHPKSQVVGFKGSGSFWFMVEDREGRLDATTWQRDEKGGMKKGSNGG